jgi:hypothetical protein
VKIIVANLIVLVTLGGCEKEWAFRDRSPLLADTVAVHQAQLGSEPNIIYLNFEGVTVTQGAISDATRNLSPVCGGVSAPFDSAPFGDRNQAIATIVSEMQRLLDGLNIALTTTRPATGPYDMLVFDGDGSVCGSAGGFGGYSPLDCQDRSPADIGFVFTKGITSLSMLAVIAAHELGHLHGLVHTEEPCDVMSNLLCAPRDKRFFDQLMDVSPDHRGRCANLATRVNSWQLISAAMGLKASPGSDGGAVDSGVFDGPSFDTSGQDAVQTDISAFDDGSDGKAATSGCSLRSSAPDLHVSRASVRGLAALLQSHGLMLFALVALLGLYARRKKRGDRDERPQ